MAKLMVKKLADLPTTTLEAMYDNLIVQIGTEQTWIEMATR
jgi:hypothetical protein